MDTRATPFGDHPDGGKISELKEGESIPDYMMPISDEAKAILDKVPFVSRVDFVLHSSDPRLAVEKAYLLQKIKKEQPALFMNMEYNKCRKDFHYWFDNYFKVVHSETN